MTAVLALIVAMLIAAVLGSCGQIFLKLGSGKPLAGMIPYLAAFGLFYGVAVLINIWAYRSGGKVSILYPVIATSYIWTALFAWKVLGESISSWTIAGTVLVIVGIAVIGFGAIA